MLESRRPHRTNTRHFASRPSPSPIMDAQELDRIYEFAVQLGKDAGKMLMDAAWSRVDGAQPTNDESHEAYAEKDSSVDIVTQTDHGTYTLTPAHQ